VTASDSSRPAGLRARRRDVDGLLLLDKPPGISSNHALQRVRWLLQAAKAGHAGTLDPLATGMLPLAFGQATKACGQLLGSTKAYRATVRFGAATDTGDAEGQVIERSAVPSLDAAVVDGVLAALSGTQPQVPPMYSALKRDGRPLYELAREGKEVERTARTIHIDRLERLALDRESLEFEAVCSKGTYIRVLASEIATALGTHGHLVQLRRLWVEPFGEAGMVTLGSLEAWADAGGWAQGSPAGLLPVDAAFPGLPQVRLDAVQSLFLRQGRALAVAEPGPVGTLLRACDEADAFLGLVIVAEDGRIRVHRLFVPGAQGNDSCAST
jgi:tRNA pseudouridine55 synthase